MRLLSRECLLIASCLLCVGYIAATEAGSAAALATLTTDDPFPESKAQVEQAIVLLTGKGISRTSKAAELQRSTHLPLIVAGRNADYYLKLLQQAGVEPLLSEGYSTDTEQNAAFTACLWLEPGDRRVFVVTDSAHMKRAVGWFRYYGFRVTPAVSGMPFPGTTGHPLLPNRLGWNRTSAVVHEWLGLVDLWVKQLLHVHAKCPQGGALRNMGNAEAADSDLLRLR